MRLSPTGQLLVGATTAVGSELVRFAGGTVATPGATDVTVGAGSVRGGADAFFHGVRVGRGGGAVSTNTCVGNGAGGAITSSVSSTAIGLSAAEVATTGNQWTAVGRSAGASNNASNWTAMGVFAGSNLTASGNWTMIGANAGRYQSGGTTALTESSNSVFLGYLTKGTQSATNEIVVGALAEGKGSNTAVWGNTSITAHYMAGDLHMVTNDKYIYLRGDATTDGSVRTSYQSGSDKVIYEKRVSGTWTMKREWSMA